MDKPLPIKGPPVTDRVVDDLGVAAVDANVVVIVVAEVVTLIAALVAFWDSMPPSITDAIKINENNALKKNFSII